MIFTLNELIDIFYISFEFLLSMLLIIFSCLNFKFIFLSFRLPAHLLFGLCLSFFIVFSKVSVIFIS